MDRLKWNRLFFLVTIATVQTCLADPVLLLNFRPYPISEDPKSMPQYTNNLKRPEKIADRTLRSMLEDDSATISGIFCMYNGFIDTSNQNGQVLFPRMQSEDTVYILITKRFTPIVLKQNTLIHWTTEERTPIKLYQADLEQDPKTEIFFWNVYEADRNKVLGEKGIIPVNTVMIAANPKHIHVPTGITLTNRSQNFILPDIFVRKREDNFKTALYVLSLKHYFRNPFTQQKLSNQTHLTIVSPHN